MMAALDLLIVWGVLALALAYLARRALRTRRAGACGSCGGCAPVAEGAKELYGATPLVQLRRRAAP